MRIIQCIFLALFIMLLQATLASADELSALLVDAEVVPRASLGDTQIKVRPVGQVMLLLSDADTTWPPDLRPHSVHGEDYLLLVEADRETQELDLEGVELLQEFGEFQLLRCEPAAVMALGDRVHGERLVYRRSVGRQRDRAPSALKQPVDPAVKSAIVEAVDTPTYERYVRELAGDQSFLLDGQTVTIPERHTARPGIDVAADYLQDRFEMWGYTVMRQSFPVAATQAENVIAVKPGHFLPDEIIVVGAHYDSISKDDDPDGPAPGAEDNGSGTAAVMHLAELFRNYKTERTIHFVLFGAEEQAISGSKHYVDVAVQQGDDIRAALTMDMMSAHQQNFRIDVEGWAVTDACDCWDLMVQFESEINAVSPSLATVKTFPGFGSDHVSFRNAEIPTLLAIESDWDSYPGYHRTTDTPEKLDFDFGALVVRGMAATLAELAVPSEIVPVLLSGFELRGDGDGNRLRWQLQADAEAGHLRLDRSVDGRAFSALAGARWPLPEQPGNFYDRLGGESDGSELRYRVVWERIAGDEVLAERSARFEAFLPSGLTLYAAEPNPFSASGGTLLRFRLPRAQDTQLDLYDAAGRHLRRLVDGRRQAGPHSIRWNGRDKQGRTVASGIYFARLRTPGEQRTRRLALLGSSN